MRVDWTTIVGLFALVAMAIYGLALVAMVIKGAVGDVRRYLGF